MNYQKEVLRTLSARFNIEENGTAGAVTPDLLHGAIGIATEAGELLDAIKRSVYYGEALDRTNLIEELGDLEWYMAVLRDALDVSQEQVQRINIDKLRARYPEKFTDTHALNRDLDREREILEGKEEQESD